MSTKFSIAIAAAVIFGSASAVLADTGADTAPNQPDRSSIYRSYKNTPMWHANGSVRSDFWSRDRVLFGLTNRPMDGGGVR